MLTAKTLLRAPVLALALAASACSVTTISVPLAPAGVRVRPEVARGYAAYEATLSQWGAWAPDHEYGVHWCPNRDATGDAYFQPYLSRGRWDVSGPPVGGAPAGTPVWRSEDPDTWGEITTHHGWWVRVPGRHAAPWCWVPGVEETPGRVAWRDGDGFVGWAPEAPDALVLVDEVDYDVAFDWVYTLLGTLTSDHPDENTLGGEARERARHATGPGRSSDGSFQKQKVGPSGARIDAARKALSSYEIAHPDAIAAAAARHPAASSSGSSSSSKSSSSHSSSKKKDSEKEGVTVGAGVAPMPAMAYYDAFLMAPPGTAGLPQMAAAPGAARGSASAGGTPGSASFGSGGIEHAHGSHGASGAGSSGLSHASSSAGHTPAYGGGHTSSSSSSSSSRSSGHASSHSSSKSSSRSSGKRR